MSWQNELKNGFRTAEQLAPVLGWSAEETAQYDEVIQKYPMLITPYYLSLVDPSDPDDPIGRMCIPSLAELDKGGSFDTSGEAHKTRRTSAQIRTDLPSFVHQPVCDVLPPLFPQAHGRPFRCGIK